MNRRTRAFGELHFAVFMYGFAAIFGALISISALALVWWRLALSLLFMSIYLPLYKQIKALSASMILKILGIGVIIGLHWLCFYGSIKMANASVALIGFAATPFFTAILEPTINKSQWKKVDFIFGILIIPAMILTLGSIESGMMVGGLVGVLSGLLAAIFSSLNKKVIDSIRPEVLFVLEMTGAFIIISMICSYTYGTDFSNFMPITSDWIHLLALVIGVTILGFILQLRSLKYISAFTSNFVISLEPVYGIVLAILILDEHRQLNLQFYSGVAFITMLVFVYPIVSKRFS